MPELRWTLLAVGALFIVGLLLWDRRRSHTARSSDASRGHGASEGASSAGTNYSREIAPLPEIRLPSSEREIPHELPIVEVADLDLRAVPKDEPPHARRPRVTLLSEHAVDAPGGRGRVAAEPMAEAPHDTVVLESGDESVSAPVDVPAPEGPSDVALVLDWPAEAERRFLSVRVVSRTSEKFSGHAIRLALAGEGFRHGHYDIFHLPMPDGRVVASAASLTRPGTFDLLTMDSQRYQGLNLFAVLPGPLPESVTLDEIVAVARMLATRLEGDLHDHRGAPLTQQRVAEMRATLSGGVAPTLASQGR
jgi:cell division protein ZipA